MSEQLNIIISKNPDLKHAEILGILHILKTQTNLTGNQLIQMTGIPKNVMRTFISSITNLLEPQKDENIVLSDNGFDLLNNIDTEPFNWSVLNYSKNDKAEKIIDAIRTKYKMSAKRDLDQFYATTASTISKAMLVHGKGLTNNADIALLGDDDLVSIALSFMYPEIRKIKVYDTDRDLLSIISESAKEYSLSNVEVQPLDARDPFPPSLLHKHDVVLTDPPYTVQGVRLFLHRAIQLLYDRNDQYIILNFGTALRNPEKTIKIQEVVNNAGLLIEDVVSKFTSYEGAETVGSRSSIYVLKTTPYTNADDSILFDSIYTFEKQAEEKFPYVDHYVFKIQKVKKETLTSKTQLQKLIGQFCKTHSLKVVDQNITKFKNAGLSFTYILASSNLVVHTWPEYGALHIDLITCSPILKKDFMASDLSLLFGTKMIEVKKID